MLDERMKARLTKLGTIARLMPASITIELVLTDDGDRPTGAAVRMTPHPGGVRHQYLVNGEEMTEDEWMKITAPGSNTTFVLPVNGREAAAAGGQK